MLFVHPVLTTDNLGAAGSSHRAPNVGGIVMKNISVKKSVLSWTLLLVLVLGTVFSGAGTLKVQAAAPDNSVNAYNNSTWPTVDASYLQDAILVGNSRMKGFVLYSGIPNLQAVVTVGWRVADYATRKKISINGKKSQLKLQDFLKTSDTMGIEQRVTLQLIESMQKTLPAWKDLIRDSFLNKDMKESYLELLESRLSKLRQ